MRVALRADASVALGAGHVMRCLALADELRRQGAETLFLSRRQAGDLCALIEAHGHALGPLPAEPGDASADAGQCLALFDAVDWLVVDHYRLDAAWERALRAKARRILAIDDLADRRHDCDLLLDQNQRPEAGARYAGLLPEGCVELHGPRHALLRPEFAARRAGLRRRDGGVERVLVFFGGADADGVTLKALAALAAPRRDEIAVDVVVGRANPRLAEIEAACQTLPGTTLHIQSEDMAGLMAAADLAIGAGGTAAWERCCLGLPCLTLGIADNQYGPAAALAEAGAQFYLGPAGAVEAPALARAIEQVIALPELLRHVGRQGMALVDGRGTARVAARMLAERLVLRPASAEDGAALFAWRNHPDTRAHAFDSAAIDPDTHARWLSGVLADPGRSLLIGEDAGRPVGVLRYDVDAGEPSLALVSIYLVPGLAGRGYGTRLLLAGERWLAAHRPGVTRLEAAIRAGNDASLGAFRAAGYLPRHAVLGKEIDGHP